MKKIILGLFLMLSTIGVAQPGSVDVNFNPIGAGANNNVWATAVQSNGKIIIGG